MLKKLIIEQFVIIERLDLEFQAGLTIFTGETGAGKSILLDALGFILGEPSDPDSIRQGSDQSIIEAHFSPPIANPVWTFLEERALASAAAQEFRVRRTILRNGEDTIMVNDKPADLEILKQLGAFLAEIHGQFANQSLLDPANQLNLLDLSGGFPPEIFKNVANALHDVHRYAKELEEEKTFIAMNTRDMPKTESLVSRFDKLGMRKGFYEESKAEYAKLLTARESSEAFQAILALLIAGNGVVMGLSGANKILASHENLDPDKTSDLANYLETALENTRAAVNEMRRLAPYYSIDTGSIDKFRKILSDLDALSYETKVRLEDLHEYHAEVSEKLRRLKNGREKVAELEGLLQKSKVAYLHHAHILSEKRVVAGKALSEAITAELPPLKLMKAEFEVKVEEKANITWTERGINEVTFTARMNPGMPFSPVAETASGGELARLILGLKVVLQRVQTIPTLIFDEVDTGIGGGAAAAVGERLAQLAETTQVLVITHSPQVASRGDQHLHVRKATDGVTTTSAVRRLTHEERIDEISNMLAGDASTAESRAAAQSLINEASIAADLRQQRDQIRDAS